MFRCLRWRELLAPTGEADSEVPRTEQGLSRRPRAGTLRRDSRAEPLRTQGLRWWHRTQPDRTQQPSNWRQTREDQRLLVEGVHRASSNGRNDAADAEHSSTCDDLRKPSSGEGSALKAPPRWTGLLQRASSPADAAELRSWIRDNLEAFTREWDRNEPGADKARTGWTALKQAAYFGNTLAVELLLEFGAWKELAVTTGPTDNSRRSGMIPSLVRRGDIPSTTLDESERAIPSALYLAAQNDHIATLRAMLRYRSPEQRNQSAPPPDVNCRTSIGWTPLFIAAWNGHEAVCRMLLAAGADPRARDHNDWTPLMVAVSGNQLGIVGLLLEVGKIRPQHVRARRGWTPLHIAAEQGSIEMIRLLLQHGADPSAANGEGWTPLHAAAKFGHLVALRLLVEEGKTKPSIARHDGTSVLHVAARYGHSDIVLWLVTEAGVSPFQQDCAGRTALHTAATCNRADICNLLVSLSPTKLIDQASHSGETALTIAFSAKRYDLALWLLQLGARLPQDQRRLVIGRKLMHHLATRWWESSIANNPNTNTSTNNTALVRPPGAALVEAQLRSLAVLSGVLDESPDRHFLATVVCIRRLVSLGIDVNIRRKLDGGTPLHTAAALANAEGVEAFVQAVGGGQQGALALETATIGLGTRGETPLHYACALAQQDAGAATVLALLRAGSNPWARDRRRRTPLHVAAAAGAQESVLRALVELGAPRGDLVYARDSRGATPLDIARETGQTQAHLVLTSLLGTRQARQAGCENAFPALAGEPNHRLAAAYSARMGVVDGVSAGETSKPTASASHVYKNMDATTPDTKTGNSFAYERSIHLGDRTFEGVFEANAGTSSSTQPPLLRKRTPSAARGTSSTGSSMTSLSTAPIYRDSMVEFRYNRSAESDPLVMQQQLADDAPAPPSNNSALFSQITNASTSQSGGDSMETSSHVEVTGGGVDGYGITATVLTSASTRTASAAHQHLSPSTSSSSSSICAPAAANEVSLDNQLTALSGDDGDTLLPTSLRQSGAQPSSYRRSAFLPRLLSRDWWPVRSTATASAPPLDTEGADQDEDSRLLHHSRASSSSDIYSEISAAPSAPFDSSRSAADSVLVLDESDIMRSTHSIEADNTRAHMEPECAVCADSGPCVQWTVYNCGHCTCQPCAEQLSECPMCRVTITSRIRLYL